MNVPRRQPTHLSLLTDDEVLRVPNEAALADPALAVLADEHLARIAQAELLRLARSASATAWAARVLAGTPLTVLSTPSRQTGLDLHLAAPIEGHPDGGLLDVLAGDFKGPGSPPQAGRLGVLAEPELPEAQALQRAVTAAVAAGDLQLEPHHPCDCNFTYGGGALRYKEAPTKTHPDGIVHVIPQTVQIGYRSAAGAARTVPSLWGDADARIDSIDPHIRGVLISVSPLSEGIVGFYGAAPALVWPDRWQEATHAQLLHAWAAATAEMSLPDTSRAKLALYAARVWMTATYEDVAGWPPATTELVPPVLPATYPGPVEPR